LSTWSVRNRSGAEVEVEILRAESDRIDLRVGEDTFTVSVLDGAVGRAFVLPSGRVARPVVGPLAADTEVLIEGCALYVSEAGSQFQAGAGGTAAQRRVRTQMPGRVVKVLVAAGDTVRQGQGLAILEAMKMENEVKARRDATVKAVLVAEGDRVESGATLIELE
jgi:biotin carboxyl carrier protein